jgi:hypothetical protein
MALLAFLVVQGVSVLAQSSPLGPGLESKSLKEPGITAEISSIVPGANALEVDPINQPKTLAPQPGVALPPLSLEDLIKQMEAAAERMDQFNGVEVNEKTRAECLDRLGLMIGYIRLIDDAHPTLPFYQWHYIDRAKVNDIRVDTDVFTPLRPIRNVAAVALRVSHGDVRVHKVRVSGVDGPAFEFNLEKTIPADLPRREFCLLGREIDLEAVEITYKGLTRKEAKAPRLILEAGVSSVPEYARHSIYELSLARNDLAGGDSRAAADRVRGAVKLLEQYRQLRRL